MKGPGLAFDGAGGGMETAPASSTALFPAFAQVTSTGLRLANDLTFEEWEAMGESFGRAVNASCWCVGDWMVYRERKWGVQEYFESPEFDPGPSARWAADRARRDAEARAREREIAVIEAENLPRRQGDAVGILQWTGLATGQVRRWTLRIGDRRDRYTVISPDGRSTGSHGLSWILDRLRAAILKRRLLQTA